MTKTNSCLAVQIKKGTHTNILLLKGRSAWALDNLIRAGSAGCSSVTQPAPCWGSYVHKLRAKGIDIETINEPDGNSFCETIARYVLRTNVSILFDSSIYGGVRE